MAQQVPVNRESVKIHIRWMIRRDMPEVMEIENLCFGQKVMSKKSGILVNNLWSEEVFLYHLRQRDRIGMVGEVGEKVVSFMVYQLQEKFLCLYNLGVHPDWQGKGVGKQMIEKLQSKLSHDRRVKITSLIPCFPKELYLFLGKYGVDRLFTEEKGARTYRAVLSPMSAQDARDAQDLENFIMAEHKRTPRDIVGMITNTSRYGIVARNHHDGEFLGFALYSLDSKGIEVNGEFGVMVDPKCRNQGIGRQLMMGIASQGAPVKIADIDLSCRRQVAFLKKMGVKLPEPQRYVSVKWNPSA